MHLKIKSIEELHQWCDSPTVEKPIVMEWAYPYFFSLLSGGGITKVNELWVALVQFTVICEKISLVDAIKRTHDNLKYYSCRKQGWQYKFTDWYLNFTTMPKVDQYVVGVDFASGGSHSVTTFIVDGKIRGQTHSIVMLDEVASMSPESLADITNFVLGTD